MVSPDPDALRPLSAMLAELRHRGPDDEGYLLADTAARCATAYAGPDTDRSLGLPELPRAIPRGVTLAFAHRRLAIIDLTPGGHGPMVSGDGRLWIIYNGEIFNYLELKADLARLGHRFRTASDTEVLLAAYAQWGADCLPRLNGMWAFALYDMKEGCVFCARDRFGVKPFHYYCEGSLFAFASEIKGLLAHPSVPRRPQPATLRAFLVDGAADEGDQTFFDGIRRLPAGHFLTYSLAEGQPKIERWYALPEDTPRAGDATELRSLLEDSVRLRLRSDVDVGTCLSGGLDSSTLVALTARLRGDGTRTARRAFTVSYADPDLDESGHAAAVVAATSVQATRTTPTADELVADLPALARAQDEPFASAAVYSQWRVMRLAREAGVTVLLDGQGADEVLGGYHYHFGPYLAEVASRRGWRAALEEAGKARRVTGRPLAFFLGLLAYHVLPLPSRLRAAAVARAATQRRVPRGLLDPASFGGGADAQAQRHRPRASLAAERRAEILTTSLPALLRYEDRNSMAFSVEARTPYLDYRLVEWAMAVPGADLIRDGWTKAVLREAARGLVPESVRLRRDKLGFATPERRWLAEIAPQVRTWLGPGSRLAPLLRRPALGEWLRAPDRVLASRSGLWRLLSVELWLRGFEGSPARC